MKMRKYLMILSFTFGLAAFTSCQDNNRQADNEVELEAERDAQMAEQDRLQRERLERENNSVAARIEDRQELSTFSEGMNRAQIDDDFRATEGPYTIFAPSNDAYDELSQQERDQMMSDQDTMRNMASAHYLIIEEEITRDELEQQVQDNNGNYTLRTMQGEELTVTMENDEIVLRDGSGNTARIVNTDEEASNGVVYTIDTVLRPQDAGTSQSANRMRDHQMQNNMQNNNMQNNNMQNDNMQNNNMQNDNMQNNNMQNNTGNTTTGNNTTGTNNR